LRSGKSAENKKKDREHERFRSLVLPVPGSFPLHRDHRSAFGWHAAGRLVSGSNTDAPAGKPSLYRPRVSATRNMRAPPNASSPRSAISGKGLAVFASVGALGVTSVSAAGGGVTA